jgi:hypothetical protein
MICPPIETVGSKLSMILKKGGSISYKYLTLKSRWEGNALDKIQRFLSVVYSNCIIGRVTV